MWSLEHMDLSRATEEISKYWNPDGNSEGIMAWNHVQARSCDYGNIVLMVAAKAATSYTCFPLKHLVGTGRNSPKYTDGMSGWMPFLWRPIRVFQHLSCSAFLIHFLKFVIMTNNCKNHHKEHWHQRSYVAFAALWNIDVLIKLVRFFVSKKKRIPEQMLWSRQVQMDVNIPISQGGMDIFYLQSSSFRNSSFVWNLII